MAGFGDASKLLMVTEPEAAAMYALFAKDPHGIKVGDTFVLCDACGGTVDLISYTIEALKPVLKISEAHPGSGAFCGSSFLNRRFEEYLRGKLGSGPDWDEDILEDVCFVARPLNFRSDLLVGD